MSKRERVRATLAGEPVEPRPRRSGATTSSANGRPTNSSPKRSTPTAPYDWDFIKFNPRATYFAEGWGMKFEPPSDQRQPRPLGTLIHDQSQLRDLKPADATTSGVFGDHLRALGMLMHAVKEDIDVVHTIFSPLSVVAWLCGTPPQFIEMAKSDGAAAHAALDAATETLAAYARA